MAGEPPPLPPPPVYVQPAGGRTDGMAIAALIVGITAIPGALFYGLPGIVLGGIAIGLGLGGRARIKRAAGTVGGGGLATAGWILGACGVVIGLLFLALIIVFIQGINRSGIG